MRHAPASLGLDLDTRDDAPRPVRPGRPAAESTAELFADLLASSRRPRRRFGIGASVLVHVAVGAALVLVPILVHEELPEHRDYIRALLYAPPPPPPLPPPRGSPVAREAARQATVVEKRPALALPETLEKAATVPVPEPSPEGLEVWGDPTGSDAGVPEGMEGGVEGGMVGGVPGGVIGGVIGGTGDIPLPVKDYDRPPRLLRQPKPVYPQEAFVRKIEGTVLVDILIGPDGRVLRARVMQSIPELDAAALQAVRQWVFSPAIKDGRPVATTALAPVSFRIY